MATPTACEVCGCTEARACDGGCGWSTLHAAVGRVVCTKQKCLTVAGQRAVRDPTVKATSVAVCPTRRCIPADEVERLVAIGHRVPA